MLDWGKYPHNMNGDAIMNSATHTHAHTHCIIICFYAANSYFVLSNSLSDNWDQKYCTPSCYVFINTEIQYAFTGPCAAVNDGVFVPPGAGSFGCGGRAVDQNFSIRLRSHSTVGREIQKVNRYST